MKSLREVKSLKISSVILKPSFSKTAPVFISPHWPEISALSWLEILESIMLLIIGLFESETTVPVNLAFTFSNIYFNKGLSYIIASVDLARGILYKPFLGTPEILSFILTNESSKRSLLRTEVVASKAILYGAIIPTAEA